MARPEDRAPAPAGTAEASGTPQAAPAAAGSVDGGAAAPPAPVESGSRVSGTENVSTAGAPGQAPVISYPEGTGKAPLTHLRGTGNNAGVPGGATSGEGF